MLTSNLWSVTCIFLRNTYDAFANNFSAEVTEPSPEKVLNRGLKNIS